MRFEVRIPIEGYSMYVVEADSEKEARELVLDGDADLIDSYWEHADLEYEDVEVTRLGDIE